MCRSAGMMTTMMCRVIGLGCLCTVVALAAGCDGRSGRVGDKEGVGPVVVARDVRKHFGEATMDVVMQAERVEVYRLGSSRGAEAAAADDAGSGDAGADAAVSDSAADATEGARFLRGRIIDGPITPDAAWVGELRAILASSDSYGWDYAKGCMPMPGVGIRFVRGDQRVDIWLCYSCTELGMGLYAAGGTEPVATASEDFDEVSGAMIALAKRVFFGDAAIQALPNWDKPI